MTETKAKEFALKVHKEQKYGEREYSFHLQAVVDIAKECNLDENIIAACWLHDTMEDCNISYKQIENHFGAEIAELVYCVTDELGRTRKERKQKTYPKIKTNEDALCVKLCDRIANLNQSILDNNQSLVSMYVKEHFEFFEKLYNPDAKDVLIHLWSKLEELVEDGEELMKKFRDNNEF